ncbi:acyl-CoA thioesterase/BAAT N-terminal domain-containing protein [Bacillus paramycoides]|uniref:acyl-CoA thioesterase/bile acid-CoA:amino acid N-acyltransferase family protein n=1 Tax=Bacillus paramycoides TaxID=2026194 RepID=UPI0022436980|nr:acyl-CoA thioesterase/bile acid-CoA:amino acid N-acyltransferase family protein [Bacillus paramycoides]MCW9134278.1 acyl-CoA thioesterase/BAAT N-terminal domain-containing protein [Bacillus paramycoides]
MDLQVDKKVSMCDEKLAIHISKLQPHEKVKLQATMSLPWAPSEKYQSFAVFIADEKGIINPSQQKPITGTYDCIDGMGLFQSMQKIASKKVNIGLNISTDEKILVELIAEGEKTKRSIILERNFIGSEVKKSIITNEFTGELYYIEENKPTIIVLGGSDGNLSATSTIAALIASHGFNTLAIGYFNNDHTPNKLGGIPLEYFEKVFKWLQDTPLIKSNEYYIHGTSKGGELALLLASMYPCITKVVANAPHAYSFQALNGKKTSSWSYKGKEVPFIKIKNRYVYFDMIKGFLSNKPFGFVTSYRKGVNDASNREDARIKVEKSNADILLIAGCEDNIWNAYDGCKTIMNVLESKQYSKTYSLLAYKNAGHPFPYPYTIPLCETSGKKMMPRVMFSSGGSFQGNSIAQIDSWEKTIDFFRGYVPGASKLG